jgi:DNA-binding transcriptional regulator YiaG
MIERRQGILTGPGCQGILTGMDGNTTSEELSPEGLAKISAVDSYLEKTIRDGRPIETLIATRRLGKIMNDRAKEAARVATGGSWSWTDVGRALGMTRQAAHEKLRARVRDEIEKGLATLERAEKAGRAKITRRAMRGREGLDRAPFSRGVESARQRINEWEQGQHEKLSRKVQKSRDELDRAGQSVQEKLSRKG